MKNTPQELTSAICSKISDTLDNYLVEGLKRKGFEFKSKAELADFVLKNCRCADDLRVKQKTYYVNETPFLLHDYGTSHDFKTLYEVDKVQISASMGKIAFL
jgi:hypothetical protein